MDRRATTTIIFAGFFLLGMVFILWGIILPDLALSLNMNKIVSGAFFTLISVGAIVGGILGGKYAQKFDFLSLFASLVSLVALLMFALSLVQHWAWLLLGALLLGACSSTLFTIGHTVIARLYIKRRAAMMGFMDLMFSLGTLSVPFYVSALYLFDFDWRYTLRILVVGLLALAFYTWRVAQNTKQTITPDEASKNRNSLSFSDISRNPIFIFLALGAFGYGMVEFGNVNWFVSYAQTGHDYSGEQARMVFAFFTGGMVVSRLIFAIFLTWFSVHRLMSILACIMVAGCFTVKLADDPSMMSAGNFLLGLGLGGLFPLMLSAAMDVDSDKGPIISGVCVIGTSIGVQVASFGTGLWAYFDSILNAFWMMPIGGVWLWIIMCIYSRLIKKHISSEPELAKT